MSAVSKNFKANAEGIPHTSGPWCVIETEPGKFAVYAPDCDEIICRIEAWTPDADKVDAALIAASPELLEAAKAVIRQWDTPNWKLNQSTGARINALRDAVAKAEAPQ